MIGTNQMTTMNKSTAFDQVTIERVTSPRASAHADEKAIAPAVSPRHPSRRPQRARAVPAPTIVNGTRRGPSRDGVYTVVSLACLGRPHRGGDEDAVEHEGKHSEPRQHRERGQDGDRERRASARATALVGTRMCWMRIRSLGSSFVRCCSSWTHRLNAFHVAFASATAFSSVEDDAKMSMAGSCDLGLFTMGSHWQRPCPSIGPNIFGSQALAPGPTRSAGDRGQLPGARASRRAARERGSSPPSRCRHRSFLRVKPPSGA